MRAFMSLIIVAGIGILHDDPGNEPLADRIARLIKQLGHAEFAKREAANKELDAIGEPALDALRKATRDTDPEICRRAGKIVQSITDRKNAAAAKKELEKLQGIWERVSSEVNGVQTKTAEETYYFVVKGDRWAAYLDGQVLQGGPIGRIEVKEKFNTIDLPITEGTNVGVTAESIFTIEGETLKYLYSGEPRATEFVTKLGDGRHYEVFRRAKAMRLPEVKFESGVFSTDLLLSESKEAIHRVVVKCRLADGEAGTLALDPTVPKFDAFGDPAGGGKPVPAVTVNFTLKLVKSEKGRQLYKLDGPKVVSRLSLVVYKSTMPWGDGRLLVHGPDSEVRRVIDLTRPDARPVLLPPPPPPPCHPGCFPAGTAVRTPDGAKPIETLREGDLVTTLDDAGKRASVKVVGVFRTRNRLLQVRVEGGQLVTTDTQPIALENGEFRAAGELKVGDRIYRWVDGQRRAVAVTGVTVPDKEAAVFNLILGAPTAFVAGDFLVRSKPPTEARDD